VVSAPFPVMQWVYRSQEGRAICELSLDETTLLYALRVERPDAPVDVQFFGHVGTAIQHQSEVEADLVGQGFELDVFRRLQRPTDEGVY
jgi:hypothetical protein